MNLTNELAGEWGNFMDEGLLLEALTKIDPDLPILCPRMEDVFKAFRTTPPSRTRIVFLGQDPYPQRGVATGLLFANRADSLDLSPSLKVIKEKVLHPENPSYKPSDEIRFDPTMEFWANQGILLLNSSLTTRIGGIGEHLGAWAPFMHSFVNKLSAKRDDLIWVFFGAQASMFTKDVENAALILKCNHPAYYARNGVAMKEDPFTEINEYAGEMLGYSINWLKPYEDFDDLPF